MSTRNRLLQPSNAELPIQVTELGIVTDFKQSHPAKALGSILITEFEISTVDNDVHPRKAPILIVVIEFGIVIDVKLLQ